MKNLLLATALLSLPYGATAETNWPQFQGVFLQMKDGSHVELPSLRYHSTQDHESFSDELLDQLPAVDPTQIAAVIFSGQEDLNGSSGLDIEWGFLVHKSDDPESYCARKCDGDLVISSWTAPTKAFNVETGPQHSFSNVQVALYARAGDVLYTSYRSGTTNGTDPREVPARAILIQGACCYAYWAFKHIE